MSSCNYGFKYINFLKITIASRSETSNWTVIGWAVFILFWLSQSAARNLALSWLPKKTSINKGSLNQPAFINMVYERLTAAIFWSELRRFLFP